MRVSLNPTPPYNLSFDVSVLDADKNTDVGYVVLPSPVTGGAYLFELGGRIDSTTATGYDGQEHAFDHLRAYCSLR
jgi:hypothetical protein